MRLWRALMSPRSYAAKPCPACDREVERGALAIGEAADCPSCHRTLMVAKVGRTWGWELASEPHQGELEEEEPATTARIPVVGEEGQETGYVVVVDWSGERIEIDWWDRGTVRFTPEDLRAALDNLEVTVDLGDVWESDHDSYAQRYHARVLDGSFTAGAPDGCSMATIPWAPFHEALEQALSAHETRKGEVMT